MRYLVTLVLLATATAARAATTGPAVLAEVDQAMNSFKDATFESKLRVIEPSGQAREYSFTTYQKVPDKRLVRFSAPGDVKGMGVLAENKDVMYVFLPGFQKVRRVGTHVRNQTFMGSDFSYEDMSNSRYSPSYEATLLKESPKGWELALTVKKGQEQEFPRLRMWVDKTARQPTKIEFMDSTGKVLKTEEYLDYRPDGPNHYGPAKVVVTDHRRNDHRSEILFLSVKLNQGLKDDLFSRRSLIRGQ